MLISFYGLLGDLIGREIEHPPAVTVSQLRYSLAAAFPEAADLLLGNRTKVATGNRLVDDDHALSGDEQVDFLPPLSGG